MSEISEIDPNLLLGVISFLKERCELSRTSYSFDYEFNGSKFKVRSTIHRVDEDGLWSYSTIEIIRITR